MVEYRNFLVPDTVAKLSGNITTQAFVKYPTETKTLPLFIKTYNLKDALSLELSKSNKGDVFNIQGPVVLTI